MLFQIHYCRSKSDVEEENDDGDVEKFPIKERIMKVLYICICDHFLNFYWIFGTDAEDIGKGIDGDEDEENEK